MKINDDSVSLATVCFASDPGLIGLGRPGFRTVWHRAAGTTAWVKEQTGATRTSAQMGQALRWFATQSQWSLEVDAAAGTASITPRAGYIPPPPAPAPFIAYRCAGCGAVVARRRRAKEGEPVWCGGRRCATTFTIRLANVDDTERDLQHFLLLLEAAVGAADEAEGPVVTVQQ